MNVWNQSKALDTLHPLSGPLGLTTTTFWKAKDEEEEEEFLGVEEQPAEGGRPLDSLSACAIFSSKCLLPPLRTEALSFNTHRRVRWCISNSPVARPRSTLQSADSNTPYSGEWVSLPHWPQNTHFTPNVTFILSSTLPLFHLVNDTIWTSWDSMYMMKYVHVICRRLFLILFFYYPGHVGTDVDAALHSVVELDKK